MRHWEYHCTRSKVALLLLINLVTLMGGKYIALITIFKIELFGEAMAFAKAPKKKLSKSHLTRLPQENISPPTAGYQQAQRSRRHRPPRGLSHVVRRGETLGSIAASYGTSIDALRRINRLRDADHVVVHQKLKIPREGAAESTTVDQHVTSRDWPLFLGARPDFDRHAHAATKTRYTLIWPVDGILTSPFGERDHVMGGGGAQFHDGIDLSIPTGTPVRAAEGGIVVFASYNGAYGKAVKLDHLNGFSTLYAHNSRLLVHVGQTVKASQVISLSGSTGRSTGPHLHFEVHKDGWPVDPLQYLR